MPTKNNSKALLKIKKKNLESTNTRIETFLTNYEVSLKDQILLRFDSYKPIHSEY